MVGVSSNPRRELSLIRSSPRPGLRVAGLLSLDPLVLELGMLAAWADDGGWVGLEWNPR